MKNGNLIDGDFKKYVTPFRVEAKVGDMIDQYEVLDELGRGTFGIVYKIRCKDGSIKALKLIKLWEIASEKERKGILERFGREFEIGKASSSYLVQSLDYGKTEGNPYIVMEYLPGGSLEKWVGKFNTHPNRERIAYQILQGLHGMHKQGFFHRDIKPQNILLTVEGHAKLTDFGISGQKTSRLTVVNIFGEARQVFGTWPYLAPEQANNKISYKALDAVTDIFSFGVTMFELFTGELPFAPFKIETESDLADYIKNVSEGNWENLHLKRHLLPGNWYSIIEGCLQPDFQHKRFKTVNEIVLKLNYNSIDIAVEDVDAAQFAVIVTYGEETNVIYPLDALLGGTKGRLLTLGRKDPSVNNHIEIKEAPTTYISRRHATLERWANPNRWIIRDGQFANGEWTPSMNSTYVNSELVGNKGVTLSYGDIITLGDTVLKVSRIEQRHS